MRIVQFSILFISMTLFSQHRIHVHVENIPSGKGNINLAVYSSEKTFLKFEGVIQSKSVPAKKGSITVLLEDVPHGEYALAIFHDANGNDKLDKNWLGIPTEKVAFSKAKMKTFGPPSYRDCCFKVNGDTQVNIRFTK
ncbi:DUF2141 domain-containing protein [Flagellimonas myxillae]|uniref:DUF2141 domain-containing protein n=1 Tax=Flagellimonas myxillae TaxID=2942214 RepID=UPI00201F1057|nr:DUF2141 domain-containing protein [Muricauda myxillae]MCL6266898.1 DUF2141 domain-containing protein [Muricauda myxillae]